MVELQVSVSDDEEGSHSGESNSVDDKEDLLFKAIEEGREEDACSLIHSGADVNRRYDNDKTVLMIAAQKGQKNAVDALLDAGADPDVQDEYGHTSVMVAAENGHKNIVKAVVRETNLNVRSKEGRTALMFAAENGHAKIVDILLEAGPEVNAEVENEGETALTLVREELVLIRLMQCSQQLFTKTHGINEKDIRTVLDQAESNSEDTDLIEIIERACPDLQFSTEDKEEMKKESERIPEYKTIRDNLLEAGACNVREIKHPQTRYAHIYLVMIFCKY